MDFENLLADVNKLLSVHYTTGRSGKSIDKVVVHYNAADLTVEGCYDIWQSREASAHYQVESSGRVGQLVNDWDTAWHAGNWDANLTSIGVEHANQGSNLTDACIESGAHLVAALCKYYGLGRPQWLVNVFPHCHFAATSCPGPLKVGGSAHARYMARAQEWYDAMCGQSAGWVRNSTGWWWRDADGSWPANSWRQIDGVWYWFDAQGYAKASGWEKIDGKWYLFDHNCHMLTGWQQYDGSWYLLGEDGDMQTGWELVDGKWYWLDASGEMAASECKLVDGKWYAFDASGAMLEGSAAIDESGALVL